jgi:tetratricopeptide (TPR) repeat protein
MNTKHLVLVLTLISFNVFAGFEVTNNPVRERTNKEAPSQAVYEKFVKLQEMIADGNLIEARAGLVALTERRLNGHETALINQFIGYVDLTEEKYPAAAKRFKEALAADSLPNTSQFDLMRQLAQIYIGDGEYQKGIDALHDYYKVTDKIDDKTLVLEANAYGRMDNYKKAIPILKKAISLSGKPEEQWNYLLFSYHMQLSQYTEAAKVLEYLISINPEKEEYFKRLSSVYFQLKKDDKSLAVLMLADEKNMLSDEKERMQLFKMYAFLGIPYKAGKVLEKGLKDGVVEQTFKNWDDLGKVWYSASEMDKALNAYDQASKFASDGKIDFQRALIYHDREDWAKAKQALKQAQEKGGLSEKQEGNSWVLLGIAENSLGQIENALRSLKQATKFNDSRKYAVQMIEYIEEKREAAKRLAETNRIVEMDDVSNEE